MDDEDRQKIKKNLVELVEETNLDTLVPKLYERGVLTQGTIHKYMVSSLLNTKVGWKVFPPAKWKMKEGRYLNEAKTNKHKFNLYLQPCIINFPHNILQRQYTFASVQQVFEFHPSKSFPSSQSHWHTATVTSSSVRKFCPQKFYFSLGNKRKSLGARFRM